MAGVVKSKMGSRLCALVLGDFLFQPLNAPAHLIEALQPGEHGQELFALERFFEKINRAPAHGFHRDFDTALRGEHDHGDLGKLPLDFHQHIQAVFPAQVDIQQNGVPFVLFQPVQSELAGVDALRVMPPTPRSKNKSHLETSCRHQ